MIEQLTEEERRELEAFSAHKAKLAEEQKAKEERERYQLLVNDEVEASMATLLRTAESLSRVKQRVLDNFRTIIEMKQELMQTPSDQRSHTFTNMDGTKRIILGYYTLDGYSDMAEDGVVKVKEFIQSLAKDDESRILVDSILKLLSKDQKGTLKASRVIQLRKMAEASGSDLFIEGVRIIEESYRPVISKQFIRAEYKNENSEWVSVPLGMTEA